MIKLIKCRYNKVLTTTVSNRLINQLPILMTDGDITRLIEQLKSIHGATVQSNDLNNLGSRGPMPWESISGRLKKPIKRNPIVHVTDMYHGRHIKRVITSSSQRKEYSEQPRRITNQGRQAKSQHIKQHRQSESKKKIVTQSRRNTASENREMYFEIKYIIADINKYNRFKSVTLKDGTIIKQVDCLREDLEDYRLHLK